MKITPEHAEDIEQLKRALAALKKMRARVEELERAKNEPVAIIGIGCRFPGGVNNPADFWQLLRAGVDAIGPVPPERWNADDFYSPNPAEPGKMQSRRGGFVAPIDQFDPQFFGISPREAAAMDPQQRLVLEATWEALEDAGQVPARLAGSQTGVFIGIGLNDYGRLQTPGQMLNPALVDTYSISGNAFCIAANRLSYLLDWRGPSMAIDTACSSSLVAVHLAVQSLRQRESVLALAGGVNLMLSPETALTVAKFLAPDGRCKFGDARANGYVRGEGTGLVVLKLLSRALADGDSIYAVIRGSAINQDGFSSGLTVPNGVAQQALLRAALRDAGVEPAQIDYVEAHGTGTALGDPIEINALGAVLGSGRLPGQSCAIGSVKTNIGHLEAAAGVAGLIKVALALKHGQIPPSLHFENPNPHISFEQLAMRVQQQLTPWPQQNRPALAGVSSFGFGGANAHVILEAAPTRQPEPLPTDRPTYLLALSAKDDVALKGLAGRYAAALAARPDILPTDVCYSANTRRSAFSQRLAVVAATVPELSEKLAALAAAPSLVDASVPPAAPKIAFLFTGQGAQYPGMGHQLYQTQPTFRAALDRCAELLQPYLPQPLLSTLYPAAGQASPLDETAFTQPALFALEYALAELWRSWGIEPGAVLGHSIGEYVAACVAGVLSLEDGLRLVAERGRLMQSLPPGGAMAAVFASTTRVAAAVAPYADAVSVAALNGPDNTVISGAGPAVEAVLAQLGQDGIKSKRLVVSHAFHSPLMEPILPDFERFAGQLQFQAPRIPLVANVTGQFWSAGQPPTAAYWRQHARAAVQFAASIETLAQQGFNLFLEIGPNPVLLGMGRRCLPEDNGLWLPSLRAGHDDWPQLLSSLAALYTHGVEVDWNGFERDYRAGRRFVSLPTYPFQRQRYWFNRAAYQNAASRLAHRAGHPLLGSPVRSPAMPGVLFETKLSSQETPFLADHCVYGVPVFPATAFIEMALAGANQMWGPGSAALKEVFVQAALTLAETESKTVQCVLTPVEPGRPATFEIYSRKDETDPTAWTLHSSGRVIRGESGPADGNRPTLAAAKANCRLELPVWEYYQNLRRQGMEYGPCFQGIAQLWQADAPALAALGRIELPLALAAEMPDYQVHPALLDACLQVLGAAIPADDAQDTTYLPIGLDGFYLHQSPGREVWSTASLRSGSSPTAEALTGDVYIFDAAGQLVAELDGIRLKRAPRHALQSVQAGVSRAELTPDSWLYQPTWQPQPLTGSGEMAHLPGNWLILADRAGVGEALANQLAAQGAVCTVVLTGREATAEPGRWVINPAQPADFARLFQTTSYQGVVHLWSLAAGPAADLTAAGIEQAQELSCGSLLYLVQAASAAGQSPRLWLATRGAQTVAAEAPALAQAPVWGLARTLAMEHPDFRCTCVDLDVAADAANDRLLFAEICSGSAEDHVAFRDGRRYVARLLQHSAEGVPEQSAASQPVRLEITARGVLDNLRLQPAARRQPGPGEIEIEVKATGLNFRDVLNALGLYPGEAGALGHECAGIVAAVGPGVTGLAPGDAVLAVALGSFSTFVTTPAALAIRKPARLTFAEAATIPITFLTASYALRRLAQLQPRERVLIHAAAGGVGLAAVQLARQIGAEIFATVGSPEKRAFLQAGGVERIFNSRTLDFAGEIMAATGGEGVDVVLNSLTGEFIPASLSVLKNGGRFLEIGKRDIWDKSQVDGLGRNLAYFVIYLGEVCEREPALIQEMLQELMADFEAGRLMPLPLRLFPLKQAADAFRYMAQARHIGKVVVAPAAAPETFQAQATYLITGGLGGLGLRVAEEIVANGGRHLALVGRRPPTAAAQDVIRQLEQAGARVALFQADVAQEAEVARVLTEIEATLPPLRGIVHAAGFLADGVLLQQSWPQFMSVLGPKVAGSWHLHRLTQAKPLDFFVMFSAGATLIGSPGQGNYAAANAFMDALAYYRQAHGQPALSINWGAWAEVGMAANLDRRRWDEQGLGQILPAQGVKLFRKLVGQPAPQVVVLPVDWPKFGRRYPQGAIPSLFVDLVRRSEAAVAPPQPVNLQQQLADLPPARQRSLVLSHVREQACTVLGFDLARPLNPQQPLSELGLDSLMAVELRNLLSRTVHAALPATLLFDYPTIAALSGYLSAEVLHLAAVSQPEAPSAQAAAITELENLSDAEAEALLLAELSNLKKKG